MLRSSLKFKIAKRGKAIFLGHCVSEALKDETGVIKVFIRCSDDKEKQIRIIEEYGIEKSEVERVRKRFDKRRAGYYYANTARKRNERIISKTISGAIYFPIAPFCAMDKIFICIFSQSEDW